MTLRLPLVVRPAGFAVIAALVYTAAFFVLRALPGASDPTLVASALTVDPVVLVPLAYYGLLVRGQGWPVATTGPQSAAFFERLQLLRSPNLTLSMYLGLCQRSDCNQSGKARIHSSQMPPSTLSTSDRLIPASISSLYNISMTTRSKGDRSWTSETSS